MPFRIVHLTSVHHPFDTRIFHRECRALARAGYAVTLIAPSAKGDVVVDGIKLRSVPRPRNRRERLTRTMAAVCRAALDENADIYHFHDPELIPVSVFLKLCGKRVIYDVHEDYASNVRGKQWIPKPLQPVAPRVVRACEVVSTAILDRVVAATPMIAQNFNPGRTRLVQNFPQLGELCRSGSPPFGDRDPLVVYVGALSEARGKREMIEAVHLVARQIPVKLVIAGRVFSGAREEDSLTGSKGLVEYAGVLDRRQVGDLLARARAGLVVLHPTRGYVHAQPTKLYEYMSAGLPLVASDFPTWRSTVESAGCGLLVDPLRPEAIADALLWLLRHSAEAAEMGQKGLRAVAEKYNWERESQQLLATYAELQGRKMSHRTVPEAPFFSAPRWTADDDGLER